MQNDWISELALKRNAQRSNCFIIETFDPQRIAQFKEAVRNGLGKLLKRDYAVLIYDLQRNSLTDFDGQQVPLDPLQSLTVQLDARIKQKPTMLIISYAFMEAHADRISDLLAAWAHDEQLYKLKSTVVVFTSSASLFNESLRRLCYVIQVIPSTPAERRMLLERLAGELSKGFEEKYGKPIKIKVDEDLVQASSGLTLHDVETAALESFYTTRKFDVQVFTDYKVQLLRNYGIEYVVPRRGFESIGGYHLLKHYVQTRIIRLLREPEKAKRYGLSVPRGVLLYGVPGTGKTFFAKAMAKEVGLPMLKISPADFLRGIVGESEARVRQVVGLIESLAPVLVFIDEYDQLALKRSSADLDSGVSRRVQNMLLDWLGDENRRSFLIAATNLVEQIDPAFIRTGRIDKVVLVLPPDTQARLEILKVHTSVIRKVPVKDVDFMDLAKRTWMWTGAELERLVLDAAHLAMDEDSEYVTQRHFEEALGLIEVNIQTRSQRIQEMIQNARQLENIDRAFLREAVEEFARSAPEAGRIASFLEAI